VGVLIEGQHYVVENTYFVVSAWFFNEPVLTLEGLVTPLYMAYEIYFHYLIDTSHKPLVLLAYTFSVVSRLFHNT